MKRYLLLALVGLSFLPVNPNIQEIVEKLTNYSLKFPQEKIFVHFDKPTYSTGETIWFKAYLVDAFSNEPITLSNVIHVELLDDELNLLDYKILKVDKGGAPGDFKIADSLPPGEYHVRAYTNWMRNFEEGFYYRKTIKVLKTFVDEEEMEVSVSPRISFFPEGGELVDGLASIVAVKATDQFGNGIEVAGKIINQAGSEVTTFATDELGMGAMLLTPDVNDKFVSTVTFEEETYEVNLPRVLDSGYNLRVINRYESDEVTIIVNAKNVPVEGSGLLAHHSGEVFYSVENKGGDEGFAVRLNRKAFPAGVCHVTFFDPGGVPRAERLVYANYPESKSIRLNKDKEIYSERSKVQLKLEVMDSLNNNVATNLSLSITPQSIIQQPENGENIINYLMLTSDLIGHVNQPAYYLKQTKESYQSLDLLMMTQGWRRFRWEEVLNFKESEPAFWAEDGIVFSGQVVDYYDRDNPRKSQVSLSILNSLGFVQGETDENGRFFFSGNDFYDSTSMVFQAKRNLKKEGKYRNDVYIKLDQQKPPVINQTHFHFSPLQKQGNEEEYLDEKKKIEKIDRAFNFDKDAIMLNEVEVRGIKELSNDPFESPFKVYGEPSNRVVVDSVMRGGAFINIYDIFRRIPGVQVVGSFPNQSILIGGFGSVNSSTSPLYLFDGVNITEETLRTISPSSISHVDVLKGADAAIYGAQGANGVVAIFTKSGMGLKDTGPKDMGILSHNHPGYSAVREFFTPDYSEPSDKHAKPDFRTTLYWNPSILVEGQNPSIMEFYTSDQNGNFDIVVQGITVDGTPVFLMDTLSVK